MITATEKNLPTEKTFPIAVYNHEKEAYWFIYSLEELIDFLNEHDEFFTYSTLEESAPC